MTFLLGGIRPDEVDARARRTLTARRRTRNAAEPITGDDEVLVAPLLAACAVPIWS